MTKAEHAEARLRRSPYLETMAGFFGVLERLVLPRAHPKGSVANFNRVIHASAALHQWKISRLTPAGRKRHKVGCHICKVRLRWRPPGCPWKRSQSGKAER